MKTFSVWGPVLICWDGMQLLFALTMALAALLGVGCEAPAHAGVLERLGSAIRGERRVEAVQYRSTAQGGQSCRLVRQSDGSVRRVCTPTVASVPAPAQAPLPVVIFEQPAMVGTTAAEQQAKWKLKVRQQSKAWRPRIWD